MRGFVDFVKDGVIEGWIVDDTGANDSLCVAVFLDGVEVNRGYPYLSRHDLIEAGLGSTGYFKIPFGVLHHANLSGRVELVEVGSGYVIPPGPIAFIPEKSEVKTLSIVDIEKRLLRQINSQGDVVSLNKEIQVISSILGVAIDRCFALADHSLKSALDLREFLERSGGLGGALGHMIGVIQQNFPPLVIPNHNQPLVSIVIPVHNKFSLTYQCLQSIVNSPQKTSFELIIVDDLSTDETIIASLVFFGNVRVLRNRVNEGFIGSCNNGSKQARGPFLFFLNNDTIVEGSWLDSLVETLDDEKIDVVGSRLIFADRSLQECGGIVWQDGSAWNWGRGGSLEDPRFRFMRNADYVSGAALMIRTRTFKGLGGFDERFKPAYYEDTDICFQVRALGKRVVVQPASTIIHLEGQSNGVSTSSGLKRYQAINHSKFVSKWKETLRNHRPNADEPDLEANREARRRAIFVDDSVPTPDQDAGSNAAFEHMKSLMRLGFHVIFVPTDNMSSISPYTQALEKIGIECIYLPYYWSLEDYLRRVPHSFEIVYLHRFSNANRFLEFFRKMRPESRIIYNVADLHFLRENRGDVIARGSASAPTRTKGEREMELIGLADATIVHSSFEADLVLRKEQNANVFLVRWPVKAHHRGVSIEERSGTAFVGGYRHLPNVDAAEWICDNLLPTLWSQHRLGIELIGSNMPETLKKRRDDGLILTGFVPKLEEKLGTLRLTIAPLRYGAGLKGKVLSSLASGTPCVMTQIACEGMDLPEELLAYVTDDCSKMIEIIARLSSDSSEWQAASEAGLAYIQREYSYDVIDKQLGAAL